MDTIHFSTDGDVGIHLTAEEQPNGDLRLTRVYQSALAGRKPESFLLRAQERQDLRTYLGGRSPEVPRETEVFRASGVNPDDLALALRELAARFFEGDLKAGRFTGVFSPGAEDFRLGYELGMAGAIVKLVSGELAMGIAVLPARQGRPLPRVEVTRCNENRTVLGVCAAADATDSEILAACNEAKPALTPWSRVIRENTPGFTSRHRPIPCPDYPGRVHLLVDKG